ncbi:unnamed protein product [Amoebophrya sp. A25]|nr:unnamed protein product [Amoebophrya sp. A25]|eukprot:GSA25T00000616001.1
MEPGNRFSNAADVEIKKMKGGEKVPGVDDKNAAFNFALLSRVREHLKSKRAFAFLFLRQKYVPRYVQLKLQGKRSGMTVSKSKIRQVAGGADAANKAGGSDSSWAASKGLRPDDVIVAINDHFTESHKEKADEVLRNHDGEIERLMRDLKAAKSEETRSALQREVKNSPSLRLLIRRNTEAFSSETLVMDEHYSLWTAGAGF